MVRRAEKEGETKRVAQGAWGKWGRQLERCILVSWRTWIKSRHLQAVLATVAEAMWWRVHVCICGQLEGGSPRGPQLLGVTSRSSLFCVVTGSCLLRSPPVFPSWVYPGPLEQGWPLWLPSWCVSKVADTTVDGAVGRSTELGMSWPGKQGSTFSGPAERLSSDLSQEVPASPG